MIPYSVIKHVKVKNQTWQYYWSRPCFVTYAAWLYQVFKLDSVKTWSETYIHTILLHPSPHFNKNTVVLITMVTGIFWSTFVYFITGYTMSVLIPRRDGHVRQLYITPLRSWWGLLHLLSLIWQKMQCFIGHCLVKVGHGVKGHVRSFASHPGGCDEV